MSAAHFRRRGWIRFARDRCIRAWVEAARPVVDGLLSDDALRARWLRHGGTWFAGVNILPNAPDGALGGVALAGAPLEFISTALGGLPPAWDRGQVSVCYPGYPKPDPEESAAAFRFRRDRDAAHLDGLLRQGAGRRRHLGETHGFILGIPLDPVRADTAPLVVYEGSHEVMRAALLERLAGLAPETWAGEDLTDAYVAARAEVFRRCPRVVVTAEPGESYLVHRLAIHGVAPWTADEGARRTVIYFRPDTRSGSTPEWWLTAP